MSAQILLETELSRVLASSEPIQSALGTPVRIVSADQTRAAFPFLRFIRHEFRADARAHDGPAEHRLSLEVFSRAGGRAEAIRLLHLVEETLRMSVLAPEGLHVVLCHAVYSDVFLQSDQTSFRGLLRLRVLSEAVSNV